MVERGFNMFDARIEVAKSLGQILKDLSQEQIYEMLELPPNPDMGDLALPCFKLSRILRKSPVQIAQDLAQSMPKADFIDRVEPVSGDRKSTRLNSSHVRISYAVFCLKKKNKK